MVTIIATFNYVGLEGHVKKNDRLRVDEARARYLIEHGLARLAPVPGPQETKPVTVTETKTNAETVPGKFSGAPTTGPSTGLPSSSAPGQAAPSPASPAAPASTPSRSRTSRKRAAPIVSASLQ